MAGSFLDTTIVIKLAGVDAKEATKSESYIRSNQPAEAPFYALRELLAGHLRILCDVHNALLAANNPPEATLGLLNLSPATGRTKESKLKVITETMQVIFKANPSGGRQDMKREMLQALAVRASTLWRNAHRLKAVNLVQSLGCFNDGKINYGPAKELRGPSDSFNCIAAERCAAAAYIYDNKSGLAMMINALHPSKLSPKIAAKNESKMRRKALKELQSDGPVKFSKSRCRALGDAYFAAMCPAGSAVLTSNLEDFEPLCLSLGKVAKNP